MDTLTGPRVETFWVELLDRSDQRIEIIPTVLGGQVEANWDAPIKSGCSIELHQPDLDVMKERIRPWVRVNDQAWPLGVFLPTSPADRFTENGRIWTVECLDKLSILEDDKIPEPWGFDAGVWVIGAVKDVIESTGETQVAVTEDPGVLRTPIAWKAGTPKRAIVNDLLNAIAYTPVWVDGFGQYRLEPYIDPHNRPITREFREGETSIHSQEWSRTQNITNVPNRVICTTDGTDEIPALVSVAENTDPDNPYSYQARGNRWKTETYEEDEAVDQAALDALAQRRLYGWMHPPMNFQVSHGIVPYNMLDVVRFVSNGNDALAWVNEYHVPLEIGGQMTAQWNGVT